MDISLVKIGIIIVGGILAGIINTMAGGGTLITFPILVFVGLDPVVAVGTNRLSILFQTLTASATFHKHGISNTRLALILSIPATIASILGALIASTINTEAFKTAVAVLIVLVLAIIIIDPKKRLQKKIVTTTNPQPSPLKSLIGAACFFLIGLYGGFFGAGVGIMMLTGLFLVFDMDFLSGNGVKVVINLFISIGATIMFAYKGKINYMMAIPLAMANAFGAYLGAKLSIKGGHKWIRRVVLAVGLVSVVKLIFF